MKKLLALPLIFIMLMKPLWPIAEYIINYDYIVANLCKNRERPQLQCDGKCYLAKMLTKETTDHNKNPFTKRQLMEVNLFFHDEVLTDGNSPMRYLRLSTKQEDFFRNVIPLLLASEIIQPPDL